MTTFASQADIKSAKTSDLLAFYNAHNKPIIKFRDRASAELRCNDLLQSLQAHQKTAPVAANPVAAALLTPIAQQITIMKAIRDHSGSMGSLKEPAKRDFNGMVGSTRKASEQHGIRTLLSVTECGGGIRRISGFEPIAEVRLLTSYQTGGGTPLFLSVLEGIKDIQSTREYNDPNASFILMATTDGQDTNGGQDEMMRQIRELQATDRWTFAFRVPKGYARTLIAYGVEPGNILEWDQTERGMAQAQASNDQAMGDFMTARATGVKSSKTFYTSSANLTEAEVKATLGDISASVQLWPISRGEDGEQIRDFVEKRLGGTAMAKGAAFYQLVKLEDKVQDYKLIAIRDKDTGEIFCGPEARQMVGLPAYGDARVRPDTAGKWQVFVQSTSVNRKVTGGTQLLYWPDVGVRFKEGKSAR